MPFLVARGCCLSVCHVLLSVKAENGVFSACGRVDCAICEEDDDIVIFLDYLHTPHSVDTAVMVSLSEL